MRHARASSAAASTSAATICAMVDRPRPTRPGLVRQPADPAARIPGPPAVTVGRDTPTRLGDLARWSTRPRPAARSAPAAPTRPGSSRTAASPPAAHDPRPARPTALHAYRSLPHGTVKLLTTRRTSSPWLSRNLRHVRTAVQYGATVGRRVRRGSRQQGRHTVNTSSRSVGASDETCRSARVPTGRTRSPGHRLGPGSAGSHANVGPHRTRLRDSAGRCPW